MIVPLRHVDSLFEATADERMAIFEALDVAKRELDSEFGPAGYNIGINDGSAAGSSVHDWGGGVKLARVPRSP